MSTAAVSITAIGQALQSGDLAGAQQLNCRVPFHHQHQQSSEPQPAIVLNLSAAATAAAATPAATPADTSASQPADNTSSTASASGSEIVLNLGSLTPGEQITIGVSNTSSGAEQVTIGVAQQNQTPEQITLNLNQNSNQEIILNLFNSTAAGSTTQGSGVSVTA